MAILPAIGRVGATARKQFRPPRAIAAIEKELFFANLSDDEAARLLAELENPDGRARAVQILLHGGCGVIDRATTFAAKSKDREELKKAK